VKLWPGLLVLLASLPACSHHPREAPPSGDAGIVIVPNQLQACANLRSCEDACQLGSGADCLSAAGSYSTGQGVPADEARAAALFAAACALHSGAGCNLAGRAHEFGHGVPVDFAKALADYEQACGLGYQGGCYNVAVCLENGRGAPKDEGRAASLYRQVCAAGSQAACTAAARLEPHP
jgi:TPR repeat protein